MMRQTLKIVRPAIYGPVLWLFWCLLAFGLSETAVPAAPVPTIPISGTNQLTIQSLDKVMLGFVQKINCTAGTLAISRGGRLLYERGYGWLDQEHKIVAPSNAYFGIASCEKPITAAAVRKLAAEGKLKLESPLLSTLGIHPAANVADRRVTNITFEEVLEHKAGWGGDIGNELARLAWAAGERAPFTIPTLLGQVMARPLESEPGKVFKYSNFGFDTMRYVVEYESGVAPGTYFRERLLQKSSCQEVGQPGELPPAQQTSRAVWNVRNGGPVFASAKYLCAFMEEYWQTGRPRDRTYATWWMYGTMPGSTAIMVWRPDGLNLAAVFNGRNGTKHEEIRAALEEVASQVFSGSPYRFTVSGSTNVPGRSGAGP
jgi:CubicO group peptidase (beta-lactamase class C family)